MTAIFKVSPSKARDYHDFNINFYTLINFLSLTVAQLRFQKNWTLDVLEGAERSKRVDSDPPERKHRHLHFAVLGLTFGEGLYLRRSLLFFLLGWGINLVRFLLLLLLLEFHQYFLHFIELLGDLIMLVQTILIFFNFCRPFLLFL
jgi:hypothetical protein